MDTDFQILIQQPEANRDDRWEQQFLDALVNRRVALEGDAPEIGPDGWPYLRVRTAADGSEPFHRVAQWASGRGIGCVVNAHKMVPDYVFTYGMLWNFVQTGRFQTPFELRPAGEFSAPENAVIGAPTEAYFPKYARSVVREFLNQQGFRAPKILVVSSADFKETDLVFSTESLNALSDADQATLASALAWFFPLHYHLVVASEVGLPPFSAL